VTAYASRYEFIKLYRITENHARNFIAHAHAINMGFIRLQSLEYEFIGNVDADITLEPGYFAALLDRFQQDSRLGVAGGYIWEEYDGQFGCRKGNSPWSVAHAVQLFRRECLEEIGGAYVPQPYGGPDWHAEIKARMRGWRVQSFPELKVFHHRPTGAAEGLLRSYCRRGLMEYSFGSHPAFELFKVARRLTSRPYVLGAAAMLGAFLLAYCRREKRCLSEEEVQFLRREQLARLRELTGFFGR
jgi:hypothetical protein